jgi:hypothetical protein
MAYASRSGRARTSAKNPQAFAVCQRCGIWYNRVDLHFQYDWRGSQLQNLFILVCDECLDVPQQQLRAITLPADPVPIFYPSVENFEQAETDYRAISLPTVYDPTTGLPIPSTTLRITENCENRTIYPFGDPVGMDQNAVMPFNGGNLTAYGEPLNLLSVTGNGTATVQVTCYTPHGLTTNDQVSIEGLSYGPANGFYSVTVLSATAFTYMTYGATVSGGLLTPTSRIITALVGLPYGYAQIPKIDGPPLTNPPPGPIVDVCFLATEGAIGVFLLEAGGGYIQLEQCFQPAVPYFFELETRDGVIMLENESGYLEQEEGP